MNGRIIIIGLDGVPFELLKDLAENGVMPSIQRLIAQTALKLKKMKSTIPEVSSVAWSSIITGCNPAEHGIFGFMEIDPKTYQIRFPCFNDLQRPPFWKKTRKRSIIINVPATYPVKEMNGVHISGFVSVDLEKSVYPVSLSAKLREMDYRLDVDSQKAHQSLDLFLDDLDKTLQARINTYRYLWDYTDWHIFMLVFTGTDRLMHFLWNAYEDKGNRYHKDFLDHFRRIDDVVGEISRRKGHDDLLLILSDHGFERLERNLYVNYLLRKEGFLRFSSTSRISWEGIDYATKAFALDPARIYIHLKGKYLRGGIKTQDREKVIRDLEDLFNYMQIDGRKVVKRICRKEEIYSGDLMNYAPDLVLLANQGFNLKARIDSNEFVTQEIFTGKHSQENAFLLADERVAIPENINVSDVVGLIKPHLLS